MSDRVGTGVRHIPALDGMRGVAVGGVLLFHAGHLVGGYLGVDLFFVLSGFLITTLLLEEWQRHGRIKLGEFWARRARRLLPALFGVLVGVAVYAAVVARRDGLNQIRGDAFATLAYVANWRAIFAGNSYWAQFSAPSPLSHTWSLAIEEQFYLVWPLIVFGLLWWRRGSVRAVLVTSVLLASASAVWMAALYTPNTDPSRVYLGTDTRASSILAGAALAALAAWRGPVRNRRLGVTLEALGWIAAAVLVVAWTNVDGQSAFLYQGGFFVCALAVVAIIASVARCDPGPLAALLSWTPLRALGVISYGVYLWHWPVYVLLSPQRTGLGDFWLTSMRLLATTVIAAVSFFALEQPVRRGAFRAWRVQIWAPAIGALAGLAVVIGTLGAIPTAQAAAGGPDPIPFRVRAEGATKVMIVGDSVASALAQAIKAHHVPWKIELLNRALEACEFTETHDVMRNLSGQIVRVRPCWPSWPADVASYRPDRVLITFAGDWARDFDPPCTPAYDDAYRARLRSAVDTFEGSGAKTTIATSAYPLVYTTTLSPKLIRARIDCVNNMIGTVAADTGASVVDLNGFVCPAARCHDKLSGAVLRPDGLHYSVASGMTVGKWLLTQMFDPETRAVTGPT